MVRDFLFGLVLATAGCTLLLLLIVASVSINRGCCEWLSTPDAIATLKAEALVLYSCVPVPLAIASAIYKSRLRK